MVALRELFASFSVDFDTKPLEHGAGGVQGLWEKLVKLKGVLAEGLIVAGLTELVKGVIEAGHETEVMAQQIGLSVESLRFWQGAAKLAGIEVEEFSTGLRFFQRNAFEAASGGGHAALAFRRMGINLKDGNGNLKNADELLPEVSNALAGMTNESERVAVAQSIFGRGGARLLPLLNKGAKGIEQFRTELEELGISFDKEGVEKSAEAAREMKKFDLVVGNMRTKLALTVIPAVTQFFGWLAKGLGHFNALTKGTNVWQAAMTVLIGIAVAGALAIIVAWFPIIATALAITAAIAAAILVVDDIITLFQGGESVIGDWIDQTWGVGTASKVVETVKGYWDDLVVSLSDAWHWMQDNIIPSIDQMVAGFHILADIITLTVTSIKDLMDSWTILKGEFKSHLGIGTGGAEEAAGARASIDQRRSAVDRPAVQDFWTNWSALTGGGPGVAQPSITTLPEVTIPGVGGGGGVSNTVNIKVDANARPDPTLTTKIKQAVGDALDFHTRGIQADVRGT